MAVSGEQLMKLWTVQYSKRQGCFHVEEVEDMLAGNINQFVNDDKGDRDYVVLAFAESHGAAHEIVQTLRANRDAASGSI